VTPWRGWDAGRTVLAVVAVMYAGVWVQVSLMHWAGGFARRAMYGPVVSTPVVVGIVAAAVISREDPWGWIGVAVLAIAVLLGLYGVYRHLKGVRSQIGGFSVRNFLSGPPPVLPLAYSLIGVVGVVGLVSDAW
jgi:hypothetical protein